MGFFAFKILYTPETKFKIIAGMMMFVQKPVRTSVNNRANVGGMFIYYLLYFS